MDWEAAQEPCSGTADHRLDEPTPVFTAPSVVFTLIDIASSRPRLSRAAPKDRFTYDGRSQGAIYIERAADYL